MWRDRWFGVVLVLLLGVQLVAMALLPLADTSEPRYAEIARLMAESGDWVTPWFAPGMPFWGKPPLSFWAQAASFRLFGLVDFAPRFPSWLATVFSLWLLYRCVEQVFDRSAARRAVTIYASCALVFITSGAVLTDPFLALGTTLCMTGLLMAPRTANVFWRYSFFLGLSVGLLAKGPLILVLVAGAKLPWLVCFRSAWSNLRALPWVSGIVLTLLLTLPWYVAAELKTPGFIDYFIVGEHFRRFLDPGWAGDLYGSAHQAPYGTIWYYWVQATFPWGLYALALFVRALLVRAGRKGLASSLGNSHTVYFAGWALFTPLFFTLSGNILWTYLLPSLAGFSVLMARASLGGVPSVEKASFGKLQPLALIAPTVVLALVVIASFNPMLIKTEKGLISYVQKVGEPATPLLYLDDLPFSARFYSRNTAQKVSEPALQARLGQGDALWVAVPKSRAKDFSSLEGFTQSFETRNFVLLYARGHSQNQLASKHLPGSGPTKLIQ